MTMTQETESPAGGRQQKVQAAEVGLGVLKALAELSPSTSLSKLAEHLGMPPSKVHRYLQALIASGFAEQDAVNNHYGLGREALQVGLASLGKLDVLKVSAPWLASLRDELDQTCFLAVWGNKGPTVVYVEPSMGAVTLVTQIGSVLPLLSSSTGLVFDSFLAKGETALLREQETPRLSADQLHEVERHTTQIRSTGVHQIQGMLMPGINAASSPLFAMGNKLVGVITVVGPGSVLNDKAQGQAARRLLETATAISERMGGSHLRS
ncbi:MULTISPECIES: IclR family transcriptional regulator [Pseudomonas syringae group]|uniref:IclR family transcriptional regulator n=3 Tax=Pseudomonas syringae group TaxID=136849 RepID=A0AAW4E4T7_PSESX|nr:MULTISPECIES: IclR family transcriptional regulator [Pseudomonas syringae group]KGK94959.1 IclR family transcriptional regulator [Pseudomonas syringae pv. tomato]KPB83628.1 Transcriptional regulator [Pseudomonas syringae pv. maculicola]KUR42868.1 HTH-type transcriptional regulator YiaJ [Pseudomonas syringae pv. tomato]KUR46052.1 HTH-type transcriptional regulator YiaJ [Pseudomonas syringae pv. tomato]MBH0141743.1 IclR family transcriptional regulator [Pseudomonas syringae pv. tomato]